MTNRISPPTDGAGNRLNYQQRRDQRRHADRDKRIADRLAKQQADAEAALNPPPPAPLPYKERQAQRKAETEGRRQAQEHAAKAAVGPPVNPFRERADELAGKTYRPELKRRHDEMVRLADEWDRKQAAKAEADAKAEAIFNDPANVRARQYVEGLKKLSGSEWQTEIAEIAGIVSEGQASLAWERIRDLEQRQWAAADAKAAAAHQVKTATDAEFKALANEAEAAKQRAAESAKMVEPTE